MDSPDICRRQRRLDGSFRGHSQHRRHRSCALDLRAVAACTDAPRPETLVRSRFARGHGGAASRNGGYAQFSYRSDGERQSCGVSHRAEQHHVHPAPSRRRAGNRGRHGERSDRARWFCRRGACAQSHRRTARLGACPGLGLACVRERQSAHLFRTTAAGQAMTATLADPAFWYGLALKIAMTASIVVTASVVVERSGPFIGSLIAALPTAGGAAMIILALEHSAQFISQSAVGSLIANAACALFALSYAALAQEHGLRLSLGGAFLVWLVTVFLLRLVDWTATGAVILNAVIYPLAIVAARRYRIAGAVKRVPVTGADLAWRAAVVTLCVLAVTAASSSIGSYFSGVLAFFPVAMGSFFIILHPLIGGPAAASVAAHVLTPLIGLGLGLLAVHLLAVPLGVWWSYAIGLSIGLAWNALLWVLRDWRAAKR